MTSMKKLFYFFFFFLFSITHVSYAQELNCKVQILAQRATTTDQQVFKTLETAIFEFMNNRKWTQDIFAPQEKIECNLFIKITTDGGNNRFGAEVTVQASRPVFNSNYKSTTLNYEDNSWTFEYVQFQPIIFTEGVYTDNLSAFLAFYAYLILGLDYDTYAPKGGSLYLQKANEVINLIPPGNEFAAGWLNTGIGQRNRQALIENVLNPRFEVIRQINYDYHRLAFDKMYDDIKSSRLLITSYLKKIEPIYITNPNSLSLQLFFAAKSGELVTLYSKAPPLEKTEAKNLLSKLDPPNNQKYEALSK